MCESCRQLEAKVNKARADGDAERERVMMALLENHRKQHRTAPHNVVVIEPGQVVWPDGSRWIVR